MEEFLTSPEFVLLKRLFCAMILGGALGFERKFHGKPVGFRTHAILSMAACIIGCLGMYSVSAVDRIGDLSRLGQGVLSGIGFIGAGIITRDLSGSVAGLTTATNMFATACIGLVCGFGYLRLAGIGAALCLLVLISPCVGVCLQSKKRHKDNVSKKRNS